MWPMGHVGVAYLCYVVFTRLQANRTPTAGPTVVVVFGSVFPDLVDKPLAWYLGSLPTGRTLAHSLLFLVPLCIVVDLIARSRDKEIYGIAFAIGAISHSLVDAAPVLWSDEADASFLLWPLLSVEEYEEGAPTLLGLLQESMHNPYFWSEFVFLGIAIVLWHRHRQAAGYWEDLAWLRARLADDQDTADKTGG